MKLEVKYYAFAEGFVCRDIVADVAEQAANVFLPVPLAPHRERVVRRFAPSLTIGVTVKDRLQVWLQQATTSRSVLGSDYHDPGRWKFRIF